MSAFFTTVTQGRWSVMPVKIMCDLFREVFLKSFVHMWSISVVLVSVILVGFVMRGLKDAAVRRS